MPGSFLHMDPFLSSEEANNMLPLLGKIVGDITAAWEQIIQKRTELECLEKNPERTGSEHREEIGELKSDLNRLIDRMTGHAADTPAQSQRQQPVMQAPQSQRAPVEREEEDDEQIEIPAFLRRQAN